MNTWTFLTNHAQVLICIAQHPQITTREIGTIVGITERSAMRILDDLEQEGYVQRHKEGRRNRYEVHTNIALRHPAQKGQSVHDLLHVLLGPN
jgi:DNA-binding MarR family transcriptional regulator